MSRFSTILRGEAAVLLVGGVVHPACCADADEVDLTLGDTRGRDVNALFPFQEMSDWAATGKGS